MFESIPGQEHAKACVGRALERGLVHAYLLAGEEGLGKTEFARELAAAVVASCGGCGACDECSRLRRGLHPDLQIVEREGEVIRIEQVARLVAELALKPFVSERRVWVILEAETLTNEAANKLLKSLEEPPAHVYFLLVSDQPERLLPTIASRCQTIEFRPVADEAVAAFLGERFGLAGGEAEALAHLARGSVARAERLAADARGPHRRAHYLKLAAAVALGEPDAERRFTEQVTTDEKAAADEVGADLAARQQEVEAAVSDPNDRQWQIRRLEERARRDKARLTRLAALDAVDHLVSWLRDLLVLGQGAAAAVWNNDHLAELEESHVARPEVYLHMLDVVGETRKDLYLNVDRRLALQAMFSRFEEVWESA